MSRRLPKKPRGFTLIELMIAAGVLVMAVAAASIALIAQYQGMQSADLTRLANGEDRSAIQSIEHALRLTGWGIDPKYAIDLKYGCSGTPCRDRINAPDDLVFVARNPLYRFDDTTNTFVANSNAWSHDGDALSVGLGAPHTVTVNLANGYKIEKGRVLLLTCAQGQRATMLTVSNTVTGTGGAATINTVSTSAPPYNDQTTGSSTQGIQACHSQSGAAMFLVDRYHYFIENLPAGCTTNCTPWLMLDTGLDLNGDGNPPVNPANGAIVDQADLIPVAKNVEDLQVAYVLNSSAGLTAPDNNSDWVLGNNPAGTAEEPDSTALAPDYNTSSTDPSRYTKNPANVRAVRVSLLIRSDHPDRSHTKNWAGDKVKYGEDRAGQTPLQVAGYRQYTAETEIYTRNLESRLAFIF